MKPVYNFKNFTTPEEAFFTLAEVEKILPELLQDRGIWNSYHIKHDDPEVWRLWLQLGDIRLYLHKIFACDEPFLHVHPSTSIVKCLKGGYIHTIAMHNGVVNDIINLQPEKLDEFSSKLTKQTSLIVPGSVYEMTDIRHFHSVKAEDISWSIMLMGRPYFQGATKQFSRVVPEPAYLNDVMKEEMFIFFEQEYPLMLH